MESPGDVSDFYSNYYRKCIRQGFIGRAQDKTHIAMENPFGPNHSFDLVLEVGSGAGDHLDFVRHNYKEYFQTDIRSSSRSISTLSGGASIKEDFADVTSLRYEDEKFDRCIATCLLLHLNDPEKALLELRRVTKNPGGHITLLVPCEPGVLLRLARALITSRKAKQLGYQRYDLFNIRDHVTYFLRIHKLIKFVFRNDKVRVSRKPFGLPSWNFNFYYVYQIKIGDS